MAEMGNGEERAERPANKGQFKKGHKGGPGRGKRTPKPAVGTDLLSDMHKAYSTDESASDSPMVKSLRRMMHDDPAKFLTSYLKVAGGGAGVLPVEENPAVALEVGKKEVKVEQLAEELLTEWEAEDAAAGVK